MPNVDETKNFFRFRQIHPSFCHPGSIRNKVLGGKLKGTMIAVCCPKGAFDEKKQRCSIAMWVQSVIVPKRVGLARARRIARLGRRK